MKINFLHFSDLHIKDERLMHNIENIADVIVRLEFDKLVVVLSGDIAFSGKKVEYLIANKFMNKLIREIDLRKKGLGKIPRLIVPGNHDIDFVNEVSSNDLFCVHKDYLKEDYKSTRDNKRVLKEKEKLRNYFDFQKSQNQNLSSDLTQRILLDFDGFHLAVNLINTAVFSAFSDGNSNDMKYHYLQYKDIQKISDSGSNLSIAIMHHPVEWFADYCKYDLSDKMKQKIDICFMGHEHVLSLKKESFEDYGYIISAGGALKNHNSFLSQFSSIIFDENASEIHSYLSELSPITNKYTYKEQYRKKINVKSKNGFDFNLTDEFRSEFYKDKNTSKFTTSIRDIFVFPQLFVGKKLKEKNSKINDFKNLHHEILNNDIVCIKGGKSLGKTSLSKILFRELEKEYVTVYLQSEELYKNVNLRSCIYSVLRKQYIDHDDVIKHYNLLSREDRVCIIDNFDLVNDREKIIHILMQEFSKLIVTSTNDFDFDEMMLITEPRDINKYDTLEVFIRPFSKNRREKLIRNVFNLIADNPLSKDGMQLYSDTIRYVEKQINMFTHTPYFTILYAKDFVNNGGSRGQKNRVFNQVFEADLTYKIRDNCMGEITVPIFNILCNDLAYMVYKKSEYPISSKTVFDVVDSYNKSYGYKIDALDFINIGKKSSILSNFSDTSKYVFSSNNYFAYYIAKKLLSIITTDSGKKELEYLLDNILIRINASVLLFFSFLIGHRTEVLIEMQNKLDMILADRLEIEIDHESFCFSNKEHKLEFDIPTEEDKKRTLKMDDENEERLIEDNQEIKVDNIFDLEVDPRNIELTTGVKAIRYLDIISKAIPDFFHALLVVDKARFIDLLYRVPNKVSLIAINDVKKTYNENKEDIYKELESENSGKDMKVVMEDFEKKIEKLFINFTLMLYAKVAGNSVDNYNMKFFEEYSPMDSFKYKIQLLSFSSETMKLEKFAEKSIKLYKNARNDIERSMIKSLTYKYLTYNKEVNYKIEQQIYNIVFEKKGKMPTLSNRR